VRIKNELKYGLHAHVFLKKRIWSYNLIITISISHTTSLMLGEVAASNI